MKYLIQRNLDGLYGQQEKKMEQKEKEALVALKAFMLKTGATEDEIRENLTASMDADPGMTSEKRDEVLEVMGFHKRICPQPKKINLSEQPAVKKSLVEALKDLKFGRPKKDQELLDEMIKLTITKQTEEVARKRMKDSLNSVLVDMKYLQDNHLVEELGETVRDLKSRIE